MGGGGAPGSSSQNTEVVSRQDMVGLAGLGLGSGEK